MAAGLLRLSTGNLKAVSEDNMERNSDDFKWDWNTLAHQKMCPETMSEEMIADIITDIEGMIRG